MKKTPTDIQDLKKDKKYIRIIPVVVGVLIVGILCVSGYVIHQNKQQAVLPAFALEDDGGIIETDNQEIEHEENEVADNEIADIIDNEVEDTEEESTAEDLPEQVEEEKPTKPVETITSAPPEEKPTNPVPTDNNSKNNSDKTSEFIDDYTDEWLNNQGGGMTKEQAEKPFDPVGTTPPSNSTGNPSNPFEGRPGGNFVPSDDGGATGKDDLGL